VTYSSYGTPCAAALSMGRAQYSSYDGALHKVQRASDSTSANIYPLTTGGYANPVTQNSTSSNGAEVDTWASLGNTCQRWKCTSHGSGRYAITNEHGGKVFDAEDRARERVVNVHRTTSGP
jgi:hypothetical protein